jgi:putative GTP pyrophosphokinase
MKVRSAKKVREEFAKWYEQRQGLYEALAKSAADILQQVLSSRRIPCLTILSRVKSPESALQKLGLKRYRDPQGEMSDLAGIRIVTYSEDDADKVAQIVAEVFQVDGTQSSNKAKALKADRVGYRSNHMICTLGEKRCILHEFSQFKSLKFEVQVRTILQHAWAEFSHSHNYKFAVVLPEPLRRKLNLIAGQLEIADNQITMLSKEIDAYQRDVREKTSKGDYSEQLNTTTLNAFIREADKLLARTVIHKVTGKARLEEVIGECHRFGIRSIADLKAFLTRDFLTKYDSFMPDTNVFGFLRDLMIYHDIKQYFKDAFAADWTATDSASVELWSQKHSSSLVERVLRANGVDVYDEIPFLEGSDEQ